MKLVENLKLLISRILAEMLSGEKEVLTKFYSKMIDCKFKSSNSFFGKKRWKNSFIKR